MDASGKDVILAAALGLELCVRIGMGGYLKTEGNIFFNKGWHATSICGAIAVAGLSAKLLNLDKKGIGDAMSIAASEASSSSAILEFGSHGKRNMLYDARQRPQSVLLHGRLYIVYNLSLIHI